MPGQKLFQKGICLSLLCLFTFCISPSLLAEIKLEGKTEINKDSLFDLKITGLPDKSIVFWDFLNNEADLTRVNMKTRFICNGPPNTYRLRVRVISFDKDGTPDSTELTADLVVKGKVDPPIPPKPPQPPDPPVPPPTPSPIPVEGLRVLIIYDGLNKSKMPKEQQSILTSKSVRDYLKSHCASDKYAEQDGKAYRIWLSTTVADNPGLETWKAALARPRTSLPWIIISNYPKGGYEGPLPANSDATIELLKKYAEPMTTLRVDRLLRTNLNSRDFDLPYRDSIFSNNKKGK